MNIYRSLILALAMLAAVNGCSRVPDDSPGDTPAQGSAAAGSPHGSHPSQRVRFREITAESGVESVYRNGEESDEKSIVESLGGGVGLIDYDRDGWLDLVFPGGGTIIPDEHLTGLPTTFYRNLGDARFRDVSAAAQMAQPQHYTHGCAAADFNNDGFTDVILTGYGGLQLFRNQGDGTFVDCTATAGITDRSWSSSVAWGDFNGDSILDLYVAHYVDWSWDKHPRCPAAIPKFDDVCTPNDFNPLPDVIYFGTERGTFRRATDEAGLRPDGKGLGVVVADLNLDSHVDIYVANDTTHNFLYINDGEGHFQDTGLISGTAVDGDGVANGSMGLAVFDHNNDKLPDIWVTNYENETFALYQNHGRGNFLYATERAGVNALGTLFVGFGTVAGDFDSDGDEDLVFANGHVMQHPRQGSIAQKPVLLISTTADTDSGFRPGRLMRQRVESGAYFDNRHRGRGLVSGDLDRDGDLDLVFTNTNERAAVLSNDTKTTGERLSVRLIGTQCNRDAIGARAVLNTDGGSYARWVVGGGSYLSQNPYTLTWAVPASEKLVDLQITWPDGSRQTVVDLAVGDRKIVVQP